MLGNGGDGAFNGPDEAPMSSLKDHVPKDLARNSKVSTHMFSSTMLYPHNIISSSLGLRKPCGSSEGSCSSSNHEEEDGRSLMKERLQRWKHFLSMTSPKDRLLIMS
ncbi:hypothetical protein ISN45_At02g003160 [Arabidopsis thaliana x Arabidopsis arenosa]|uniref:Uncharacterized protein n=2 Tax=Arabidopsis thaliana x Arabidopsis arenosa TaxID=1240361 RepID=A0A8T2FLQ7_9BRAS|nr:hypothetical protein ISN45_At02g003160 [Arabidopsis thaliana x Arabidopsis arenosa]